jgi:hypothetical protein
LELLSQIPLQLPGPPSHRLSYDKAFRKLIYPTLDHRILYGSVFLENLDGPVRLSSQETVAGTSHPCPSAADKPASIFLPALEACPSSDDVAFLRKREKLGPLSKYIFYGWPIRLAGSLLYECKHWQLVEFRPLYPAAAASRILEPEF